jgi:hypothetical protein
VEIGLAFSVCFFRKQPRSIYFITIIFAIFAPLFLAASLEFLKSIFPTIFVFMAAILTIQLIRSTGKSGVLKLPPNKLPSNLTFQAVLPKYLPLGLEKVDNYIHKKNQQITLEGSHATECPRVKSDILPITEVNLCNGTVSSQLLPHPSQRGWQ